MNKNSIKGIVARDTGGGTCEWQNDLCNDMQGGRCGVMWKDSVSDWDAIEKLIVESIKMYGSIDFYNIASSKANFKGKIIDFATEGTYNQKMEKWKSRNPAWFCESWSEYDDGRHKAKYVFLLETFERIKEDEQIPENNFVYYSKKPSIKNAVAFTNILTSKQIMEEKQKNVWVSILNNNKNIILTGAPGTGKTYTAKNIAKEIGATSLNGRLGFVQFHPSYDYTDFVEGLRPTKDSQGNIGFERKDGIFMDFCRKALNTWNNAGYNEDTTDQDIMDEHKYVFVIDEINRGELSKIFGELFFSIDPGYRGEKGKIITQYHNLWTQKEKNDFGGEEFYVPNNVYIIGTMNDIDRSVESMDFAMRRRFTFKEVTAADSVIILESIANISQTIKDELKARMIALNEAIGKEDTLGTAYQLGAAYFKKIENCLDDNDPFQTLWNNYLSNILQEYLRGMGKTQMEKKMLEFAQAFKVKSGDNE